LGCSGVFALETHFLLEGFTKVYNGGDSIDYYLQDTEPRAIAKTNLHSVRSKYYLDFKRLRMGLDYFIKKKNYTQIYNHLISYIENFLCIGEIIPIIEYHLNTKEPLKDIIKEQKGYYPLDQKQKLENLKGLRKRAAKYRFARKKGRNKPRKKSRMRIVNIPEEKMKIDDQNGKLSFYRIFGTSVVADTLYFDRGHYNSQGAEAFTREIGNTRIKIKK